MELQINRVQNGSRPEDEFVIINVLGNIELYRFGITDKSFNHDNRVSNKVRHFHWFENLLVQRGDVIILHTGIGKTEITREGFTRYIHLYWGLNECIWNNNGSDAATLIKFAEWDTKKVR